MTGAFGAVTSMDSTLLFVSGNSFGVKHVLLDAERNLRTLHNDTTTHGIQSTLAALSREPLAYYHRSGPLGDVFSAGPQPTGGGRIAVVGLGVGAMAAYAQPGQHFTFYEIDPGVARIAENPQCFTFLTDCRGTYDIVLGDGLEKLALAPDRCFDLIILDAFSSDIIPRHLVSGEALKIYLSKLADGGLVAFHITNVHVELEPVLGQLAAEAGLVCLSRADLETSDAERSMGKLPSHYLALAQRAQDIRGLADAPGWRTVGST